MAARDERGGVSTLGVKKGLRREVVASVVAAGLAVLVAGCALEREEQAPRASAPREDKDVGRAKAEAARSRKAEGAVKAKTNPGPGDAYPDDFAYDVAGGGTFRLADFKGKKAVLITSHLVDDGPVSWLPDPFKRLQELQASYREHLAVAVMPEFAHLRNQDPALWKSAAEVVRELQNPGELKVLIENTGTGARFGFGDFSLYKALNPEGVKGWWAAVLIDQRGRIVWSGYQPYTRNSEHILYETRVREQVVRHVDPAGYRKWRARVPRDWVKQESPWGTLEIEDFERYGDMGDYHVSPCWQDSPRIPYKGELARWPARTGYRSLAVTSWMRQGSLFGYPYYYGYRQVAPSAPVSVRHEFAGAPRTGTLAFFAAKFPRAVMFDYFDYKVPKYGLALRLEGPNGAALDVGLGGDGRIHGSLKTAARWNARNAWSRVSFHVDPREGTRVFLGRQFLGRAPRLKGLAAVRFQGVLAAFVDDFVLVPRLVSPEELDAVYAWVDEHAIERPHVTPLERDREIARLAAKEKVWRAVLRVDWGATRDHKDAQGRLWRAGQPWLRGTFGSLDGDVYAYPADIAVKGSKARIYRTVHYCMNRLRFTAPNGTYTLRIHTARPFRGPDPNLGHTNHGRAMRGWEARLHIELQPDGPGGAVWKVKTPYRTAAVYERKGIVVTGGVLDVRFNFDSLPHVAATELIQESVDPGHIKGIPAWPSTPVSVTHPRPAALRSGVGPIRVPEGEIHRQ